MQRFPLFCKLMLPSSEQGVSQACKGQISFIGSTHASQSFRPLSQFPNVSPCWPILAPIYIYIWLPNETLHSLADIVLVLTATIFPFGTERHFFHHTPAFHAGHGQQEHNTAQHSYLHSSTNSRREEFWRRNDLSCAVAVWRYWTGISRTTIMIRCMRIHMHDNRDFSGRDVMVHV